MILNESHISLIFLSSFDKVACNPSTPIFLEGQTAFDMQFFRWWHYCKYMVVVSANYNLWLKTESDWACRSNDMSYVLLLLLQNGMSMRFFTCASSPVESEPGCLFLIIHANREMKQAEKILNPGLREIPQIYFPTAQFAESSWVSRLLEVQMIVCIIF